MTDPTHTPTAGDADEVTDGPTPGDAVADGDASSDAASDEATADEGPDGTTPRAPRAPSWWAGWILAVLALLGVAVLSVLLVQERGVDEDRAAAEEAAGRFALTLTSWDASDGMGDTREQLREASTERFAEEVDQLFGGTDDLAELEQIGARSQSEVDEVLVQRLEGDEAEALAVVVQRVTTDVTDGEEVSLRYARIGMVREGDAWQVDRVELLVDLLQESAERLPDAPAPGDVELNETEDDG